MVNGKIGHIKEYEEKNKGGAYVEYYFILLLV